MTDVDDQRSMTTDAVRTPRDISQTQVTALTDTAPHSMRHSK
jgi:hypothetical protein